MSGVGAAKHAGGVEGAGACTATVVGAWTTAGNAWVRAGGDALAGAGTAWFGADANVVAGASIAAAGVEAFALAGAGTATVGVETIALLQRPMYWPVLWLVLVL